MSRDQFALIRPREFPRRRSEFRESVCVCVCHFAAAPGQTGLTDSFYATARAFSSIHARDLIREMHRAVPGRESLGVCKKLMTSR